MDELIRKELEQETITPFHGMLLQHCRRLVNMSRRHMAQFYSKWDDYNDVYRGIRRSDKADKAARDRDEPQKMVVPLSYAQTQTFVAFCMGLYYQRDKVFELIGTGEEDHKPAKIAEALLDRDLTYNVFESRLYQFLLDVARFGLGVFKTGWVQETQQVQESVPQPPVDFMGMQLGGGQSVVQSVMKTRFAGNRIYNVSPYRFFPDVRLPICKFQQGEFCASEDEWSYVNLRDMEKNGDVAGIRFIKGMQRRLLEDTMRRYYHATVLDDRMAAMVTSSSGGVHLLTECQVSIVPADFLIDGKPIGDETWPVKWNVWYVNDQRVVKAEPLGYVHNEYTYDVGEYSPDLHELVNNGISATIDQLQSTHSWFINSHITSVRKTIQNHMIVDPSGVRMDDVSERRPIWRLKPEASRTGVDKWVKQFEVRDVTQNHVTDAKVLQDTVEIVTGINANALGQFNEGRRSATEARNVNSATAARLKMIAQLIFRNALEPMGRKMIANHREYLDDETIVRVTGLSTDPQAMQQFLAVTKADLVGSYDFRIFDGTLPSERQFQAQALQDMLEVLLGAPQLIPFLGYDPRLLVKEWLELRGILNPERFEFTAQRQQELQMMQQQMMLQQLLAKPQAAANGRNGSNGSQAPAPSIAVPQRGQGLPVVA